jgi:hypothetical protein
MEAVRTSVTSVDNHFTRQYNPEDSSEHHISVIYCLSFTVVCWQTFSLAGEVGIALLQRDMSKVFYRTGNRHAVSVFNLTPDVSDLTKTCGSLSAVGTCTF